MNVLEKILEEIEDRKSYHEELLSQRDDYEIQKMYCDEELNWIREIICSHMNDVTDINVLSNWIPCSEKLPEETEYYLVQLSKNCQMKIMQIEWLCCMTEKKRYLCVMKNL